MPFDPIELARITEEIVCDGEKRKYYRFRYTGFYGGSATADVVGCNLRCVYCWSWKYVSNPEKYGRFYSPREVVNILNHMLRKHGGIARLTGGEPTICFRHLLEVMDGVEGEFVLETNGILLDEEKVRELSNYDHIFVRVSLKGVDRESFERVTGAKGEYFDKQIEALKLLAKYGVPARPAILFNLFPKEKLVELQRMLLRISPRYVLELEPFSNYGGALERLRRAGLHLHSLEEYL
ncbi:MAG: radical SAM protein [Candidatus Diapherotrites archaeon]|nr:radical SAM protein [Candidatus Diapherotrites archaeon]